MHITHSLFQIKLRKSRIGTVHKYIGDYGENISFSISECQNLRSNKGAINITITINSKKVIYNSVFPSANYQEQLESLRRQIVNDENLLKNGTSPLTSRDWLPLITNVLEVRNIRISECDDILPPHYESFLDEIVPLIIS